jgi:hypothetical protein
MYRQQLVHNTMYKQRFPSKHKKESGYAQRNIYYPVLRLFWESKKSNRKLQRDNCNHNKNLSVMRSLWPLSNFNNIWTAKYIRLWNRIRIKPSQHFKIKYYKKRHNSVQHSEVLWNLSNLESSHWKTTLFLHWRKFREKRLLNLF